MHFSHCPVNLNTDVLAHNPNAPYSENCSHGVLRCTLRQESFKTRQEQYWR
uniref:Uncharacterized protein n=1 Tax=Anguilla anguilla TaxID=7936 RepID=A0A0E9XKY1_ANGAN